MSASLATAVYATLILALFWLDRTPRLRTSLALWLPVVWLFLAASRSPSEWLDGTPPAAATVALLDGDPFNRTIYTCLVVLGILVLAFRLGRLQRLIEANLPIVAVFLYCLVSLLWAEYPDVGFKRWFKAAGDVVMVLVVVSDRDPWLAVRRLLSRAGFLLIPLSVLMIKYYPELARYYGRWDATSYFSGVTTNKNTLGVICLIFGLASFWQLLLVLRSADATGRFRRFIAHGAMLAMVAWLFALANSMTSLSCFLVGAAVMLAASITPQGAAGGRRMLVQSALVLAVAVPAAIVFIGLSPEALKLIGRDPTLTDRTGMWALLFSLSGNPWLGTGFENFWQGPRLDKIWSVYSWRPNQAHNGFIETFLNIGWIGVGLTCFVLYRGYRAVMERLETSPSMGPLLAAFFAAGVVYNFTEAALLRMMAPAWIMLLLASTRVPLRQEMRARPGTQIRRAAMRPGRFALSRASRG